MFFWSFLPQANVIIVSYPYQMSSGGLKSHSHKLGDLQFYFPLRVYSSSKRMRPELKHAL